MEIHGNHVSRLPHSSRLPRSVSPNQPQGDSRTRSSAAVGGDGPRYESWRYERIREDIREVYADNISSYARRALDTYIEVGRPDIPETLVRLDCYV